MKGIIKASVVSGLAMFVFITIMLMALLSPLIIPFLVVLLILTALGVADYRLIVKPLFNGIVKILKWPVQKIKEVIK
jgi:hypothetical protein